MKHQQQLAAAAKMSQHQQLATSTKLPSSGVLQRQNSGSSIQSYGYLSRPGSGSSLSEKIQPPYVAPPMYDNAYENIALR
jgi:hypothetical protein